MVKGGENIYPLEIEERLAAHPSIERAIVVGVPHKRLGEVVGAFLQRSSKSETPLSTGETLSNASGTSSGNTELLSDDAVRAWVRTELGRHKAPAHIFWLGDDPELPKDIPLTGSGKVKKYEMAAVAEGLVQKRKARL